MSEETPTGVLGGKFLFKTHPDGTLIKNKVQCVYCNDEFSYHRSTTSLKYHLRAKHVLNTTSKSATSTNQARQTTLEECSRRGNAVNKCTADKLTKALAEWIATECGPISIVEDHGLQNVMHISTGDPSYKLPSRGTITTTIHQLYDDNKAAKIQLLANSPFVSLTGDHCNWLKKV